MALFCINCGQKYEPGDRFCSGCGAVVGNTPAETPWTGYPAVGNSRVQPVMPMPPVGKQIERGRRKRTWIPVTVVTVLVVMIGVIVGITISKIQQRNAELAEDADASLAVDEHREDKEIGSNQVFKDVYCLESAQIYYLNLPDGATNRYFHDDLGRMTRVESCMGDVIYSVEYSYDEANRIVSEQWILSAGNTERLGTGIENHITTYTYDINGNRTCIQTSDEEGNVKETETIFYRMNEYGMYIPYEGIVQSYYKREDGTLESTSRKVLYAINPDGQIAVRTSSSSPEVEYSFDKDGKLLKRIVTYLDDPSRPDVRGLLDYTVYSYTDDGKLESITEYDEFGSVQWSETRLYNEDGLETERIQYDAAEEIEVRQVYEYDEVGNLVTLTSYGEDGAIESRAEYIYTVIQVPVSD